MVVLGLLWLVCWSVDLAVALVALEAVQALALLCLAVVVGT